MRIAFVDVEQPVTNVYVGDFDKSPKVGAIWHLGLTPEHSMYGGWRILSHERVYEGRGFPDMLRCNVVRAASRDDLRDRLTEWTRRFVVSGGWNAQTAEYAVDELMREFAK